MQNELRYQANDTPHAVEALRLKAAQCRRLASTIADRQTVEALTALAEEYECDAKARRA